MCTGVHLCMGGGAEGEGDRISSRLPSEPTAGLHLTTLSRKQESDAVD